jgi:Zn-dependent protease
MDLSPDHLRMIVENMIILILSIAVHEFGHAFVADRLGDRLPRQQGRVTLNPAAHADPVGTLAVPALGMLLGGFGFGWGKPVQVSPVSFTRKLRMRTAHMLVAAAGPTMNVLFATLIGLIVLALVGAGVIGPGHPLYEPLHRAIFLNFILAFFNLLPTPPLDGGAVLQGLLPDRLQPWFDRYAPYGIFVLIAVIVIPRVNTIFIWPALQMYRGFTGLLGI